MTRISKKLLLAGNVPLVVLFALAGCVAPVREFRIAGGFNASVTGHVALLPFSNQTTDLRGPEMIRNLVYEKLRDWGYVLKPLDSVDAKLMELGITDAGQLPALKPSELGQALEVDALCYGELVQFTFQNIGFFVKRAVSLRLSLVSGSSGEVLWEGSDRASSNKLYLDKKKAKKAFITGMAIKAVENMLKAPLYAESKLAVRRLFEKVPRR